MKKQFSWLIFLLGCLIFMSCTKKNKVVVAPTTSINIEENGMDSNENEINGNAPSRLPELPKVYRVVTIQKTGCFGDCPDYEFILHSNGEATYIGKKNVPRIGRYKTLAHSGFMFSIKSKINEGEFFKMSTIYPENKNIIKDLPETYIMVSDNIHQIIIRNNHDAPSELIEFQNKIEKMIEELKWEKK